MMPIQRTRIAENRVRNKLSNGPRRVQSNVLQESGRMDFCIQSILQRIGIRQLPRICQYPVKCTGYSRKCKVAPRIKTNVVFIRP